MPDTNTYAMMICEEFEELLDEHDISIPDEDRQGFHNEARLYGATWGTLVDNVREILDRLVEEVNE